MDDLPSVRRCGEAFNCFHLCCAGPVTGFDLAENDVDGSDADEIKDAKTCRCASASIALRLEESHRAVFVAIAFGFTVQAVFSSSFTRRSACSTIARACGVSNFARISAGPTFESESTAKIERKTSRSSEC